MEPFANSSASISELPPFRGLLDNIKIFLLYLKTSESLRCLRDAGFHWAFIFIALVPIAGPIALIVMLAWPSKKDEDTDTEEQDQITA